MASTRASRIFSQTPLSRHRQNRRCTFFQFPYVSGKSRQGAPVRSIQNTPLINCRVSRALPPRVPFSPMVCGLIFSHALSLMSCRPFFFEDYYITFLLTTPSKRIIIKKDKKCNSLYFSQSRNNAAKTFDKDTEMHYLAENTKAAVPLEEQPNALAR